MNLEPLWGSVSLHGALQSQTTLNTTTNPQLKGQFKRGTSEKGVSGDMKNLIYGVLGLGLGCCGFGGVGFGF